MKNTLKWQNTSIMPFTINIYRGSAPLDRSNLTNPIATLTNGETTYADDVPRGSTNYYVVETVKGTDKAPSNNIQIVALPKKGPGPLTLKQGDYNYGYFGTLPSRDFISGQTLFDQVGLTPYIGLYLTVTQSSPTWHKYIRNGKVLFVPNGPIAKAVYYQLLYNLGLVFGVSGPGPYKPAGSVDVNQLKYIEFGGNKYIVRLMSGYDDNLGNRPVSAAAVAEPTYNYPCEWNDLVYPLCEYTPNAQRMANVQQATRTQLNMTIAWGIGNLVKELTTTSQAYVVGQNVESRGGLSGRLMGSTGTGTDSWFSWWPVLELVE